MSGESTSAAGSSSARPDDPRLGQVVTAWTRGDPLAGRPVIIGFPQDEGVRRNGGRVGAAGAPALIRRYLHRLVAIPALGVLDAGDISITADLEASQDALAEVVADVLRQGGIPIVLGGGHETAYGVFLGHQRAGQPVAMLNLDAHLDVRPTLDGLGHSGSPFRQMLDHPAHPLSGDAYACIGAQPYSVSVQHLDEVRKRGGLVKWSEAVRGGLALAIREWSEQRTPTGAGVHLSVDADVVSAADVPGVSAPNPTGLSGWEVAAACQQAGELPSTRSLELVELNPRFDVDDRSSRWGAVAVWHFLAGLALRSSRG